MLSLRLPFVRLPVRARPNGVLARRRGRARVREVPVIRLVAAYALAAGAWILLSDQVVAALFPAGQRIAGERLIKKT